MPYSNLFPSQGSGNSNSINGMSTINGVMVGVVTNNKDPDGLNRVKLKFPLRENTHETDWVPITSLMSGKGTGTLFVPEVGDEVLVAFLLGHLNQPFVIGSIWNQEGKPPAKDEKNNLRKIHSRAGHELIFDDTDGAGKVTVKTKQGHLLELDEKSDKVTLSTKSAGPSIVLEGASAGSITVKSGANQITIDNKGDISIQSNKAINVKSTQINIEASVAMKIKAGGTLDLMSDGMITIKGAMVKIN